MKKLLPFLIVIVYMNSGKVFTYYNGVSTRLIGGSSPLIGTSSPDSILEIQDKDWNTLAYFPLKGVERWEVK